MVAVRQFNPLARAILVIGAVMVLVTGVTLAALRDTVAIQGNTIGTATADLKIWNGTEFAESTQGFAVEGLVPGEGSDEYFFYLANEGDSALDLAASVDGAPSVPEGEDGYDFVGWENLKVTFTSYAPDCEDAPVTATMAELMEGEVELPCNPLDEGAAGNPDTAVGEEPGEEPAEGEETLTTMTNNTDDGEQDGDDSGEHEGDEGKYSVSFDINPEAVTGDNPSVGSFDLIISGTAAGSDSEETPEEPVEEVPEALAPREEE